MIMASVKYAFCKPVPKGKKVACLIREIKKDKISPQLKCRRVIYLKAINKKQRFEPQASAERKIKKALRDMGCAVPLANRHKV
jgi:hypothetical protein